MGERAVFAAAYEWVMGQADRAGLGERRRRLLAGAKGRVLDVGAGTGANLAHYPPSVDEVVTLEPDGAMRERLQRRLGAAPVTASVHPATLEEADLRDESFDTVVCTLVLCTVVDLKVALDRIRRLLAPGGVLLFLEHVRAWGWPGHLQRALTPAWKHVAGGCHLDRDIPAAMRASGLVVTDLERFRFPWVGRLVPAVQGSARPRTAPATAMQPSVTGRAAQ